ncbi:Hypothetical protein CAP_9046 [Chondromyces apiculatus DSM 436]|uniref:Uncharacterized protein n=1 Tax=Chondromyces apiculatus DSM 436 TaxID=1192034 RepID=A0A017SUU4_9BACT|nr:Hypothetical protein CAP_9046 [Chondromyces apiculatus DSM 436]
MRWRSGEIPLDPSACRGPRARCRDRSRRPGRNLEITLCRRGSWSVGQRRRLPRTGQRCPCPFERPRCSRNSRGQGTTGRCSTCHVCRGRRQRAGWRARVRSERRDLGRPRRNAAATVGREVRMRDVLGRPGRGGLCTHAGEPERSSRRGRLHRRPSGCTRCEHRGRAPGPRDGRGPGQRRRHGSRRGAHGRLRPHRRGPWGRSKPAPRWPRRRLQDTCRLRPATRRDHALVGWLEHRGRWRRRSRRGRRRAVQRGSVRRSAVGRSSMQRSALRRGTRRCTAVQRGSVRRRRGRCTAVCSTMRSSLRSRTEGHATVQRHAVRGGPRGRGAMRRCTRRRRRVGRRVRHGGRRRDLVRRCGLRCPRRDERHHGHRQRQPRSRCHVARIEAGRHRHATLHRGRAVTHDDGRRERPGRHRVLVHHDGPHGWLHRQLRPSRVCWPEPSLRPGGIAWCRGPSPLRRCILRAGCSGCLRPARVLRCRRVGRRSGRIGTAGRLGRHRVVGHRPVGLTCCPGRRLLGPVRLTGGTWRLRPLRVLPVLRPRSVLPASVRGGRRHGRLRCRPVGLTRHRLSTGSVLPSAVGRDLRSRRLLRRRVRPTGCRQRLGCRSRIRSSGGHR